MEQYVSDSPEGTQQLASRVAAICNGPECITLSGDLGAGKTCFAQGFIQALAGADTQVQSPTFLLVKPYSCVSPMQEQVLYHMDLYRIEHEGELMELGLEEYLDTGICLIEWPEIAKNYLPPDRLAITIENVAEENQRKFTFSAKGDWQKRLNNIYLPS